MASCILVLAESPEIRAVLTTCLKANQHDTIMVDTVEAAIQIAKVNPPDLLLAEVVGGAPAEFVSGFRASIGPTKKNELPLPILLLDRCATPVRRVEALSAGARDVVPWPPDQRLLLARLRGVLREVHASREVMRRKGIAEQFGFEEETSTFTDLRTVAFVTSRESCSQLDDVDLSGVGARIRHLTPEEAIGAAAQSTPIDAFVLDGTSLPNEVTINTLPELRAREHSRHAMILFIHDAEDPNLAASALDSGASDILANDSLDTELIHRVNALLLSKIDEDALRKTAETSLQLAATDPLTGLFNRRYAQTYLKDALENGNAHELTAMIVDIDHFKRVNDTHGHAAGDAVLVEVANRMRQNLRAIDLVARLGGEEFLIVLPGTDKARAGPAAERLRLKIGGRPIAIGDEGKVRVTVSIGVSVGAKVNLNDAASYFDNLETVQSTGEQVQHLLEAADKALYKAKESGRNRIQVADASA